MVVPIALSATAAVILASVSFFVSSIGFTLRRRSSGAPVPPGWFFRGGCKVGSISLILSGLPLAFRFGFGPGGSRCGFQELVAMRVLLDGVFLLGFFNLEFLVIVRPVTFSGELPPNRLLCGNLGSVTGFHGFPVFLELL